MHKKYSVNELSVCIYMCVCVCVCVCVYIYIYIYIYIDVAAFVCDISCLESLTMVEEQKHVTCSTHTDLKSHSVRSESNNIRMMKYKGIHKL